MTTHELEAEIAALEKLATTVPQRLAGRHLMKIAALKRELMKLHEN